MWNIMKYSFMRRLPNLSSRHPVEVVILSLLLAGIAYFSFIHIIYQEVLFSSRIAFLPTDNFPNFLKDGLKSWGYSIPSYSTRIYVDEDLRLLNSGKGMLHPYLNDGKTVTLSSTASSVFTQGYHKLSQFLSSIVSTILHTSTTSSMTPSSPGALRKQPMQIDTIYMKQIYFIANNSSNSRGVLSKEIFHVMDGLQEKISHRLRFGAGSNKVKLEDTCYKEENGHCLVYSPLSLLSYPLSSYATDEDLLLALHDAKSRIPLSSLFKNMSYVESGAKRLTGAKAAVLTYFLELKDSRLYIIEEWDKKVQTLLDETLKETSRKQSHFKSSMISLHQIVQLAKNGFLYDAVLLLFGYTGMHVTFFLLFKNMRRVGSNFALAAMALVQGLIAFILALLMVHCLGYEMNYLLLMEALPFIVMAVSFRKPYLLTKAVVSCPVSSSVSARVLAGVERIGVHIILNYLKECSIFLLFFLSGIPSIQEISLLATLTLIMDAFFLFTFFVGILSLRLELKTLKDRQAAIPPSASASYGLVNTSDGKYQEGRGTAPSEDGLITKMKLFVTFVILSVYAMNILSGIYTKAMPSTVEDENLVSLLRGHEAFNGKIIDISFPIYYQEPSNENSGAYQFSGLLDVLYHVYQRSISYTNGYLEGNKNGFVGLCLLLLLPFSLVLNYYFYRAMVYHQSHISHRLPPLSIPLAAAKKMTKPSSRQNVSSTENVQLATFPAAARINSRAQSVPRTLSLLPRNDLAVASLTDEKLIEQVRLGQIPVYKLESLLRDYGRAVRIRRLAISASLPVPAVDALSQIPHKGYDYAKVVSKCCENVIGYVPIPVGVVGPYLVDGIPFHVPMATTEGALLASTQRGCKALTAAGGTSTIVYADGITRGPVVSLPSIHRVLDLQIWLSNKENFAKMKAVFNSTSRFGRLQSIKVTPSGCDGFLRFKASTGDAMGMNMVSKGVEKVLSELRVVFPDMKVIALSGNYCTDKKAAAINWIEGRGKSVISSAVLPASIIASVLKVGVVDLVAANMKKNFKGSAMAGVMGGYNAHAANIVAVIFLATGQDPAQVVVSANCMTEMESVDGGRSLRISCTMPSIEVGTVGGGTQLQAQAGCLGMMSLAGSNELAPGQHSQRLARVVCATVLAGELSLMAALTEGTLVESHLALNRTPSTSPTPFLSNCGVDK